MRTFAFIALLAGTFAAPAGAQTVRDELGDLSEPTRLLFVFDASNSMNAFWGGTRKIEAATRLLGEALDELYGIEGLELGLRVYGHQTTFVPGEQDCDDTELVVPISSGNNLHIRQALKRIQARGTTPIAHSLELAAGDFSDTNGRNVIILITDGIEACDGDPCAVSKALQARNVVVKPFIIGIGLDDQFKETFRCVGNYFDATDTEMFREVLDIVIEQAMHDTTVEVDLIAQAASGSTPPTFETNVAITFAEHHLGAVVERFIHTLNHRGVPDTLHIDPVPTYRVTAHTIPPMVLDSIRLDARSHNRVIFPNAGQGIIQTKFALTERNPYGELTIDYFVAGGCSAIHTAGLNDDVKVLNGNYDLRFATVPPTWVRNVAVRTGRVVPVEIPAPGDLVLDTGAAGYGTILDDEGNVSVKFDSGNPSGRYTLQPGRYHLVFRARGAQSTDYSITRTFTITSGNTTNLTTHG
jgi:Ca-activated chloride channel homolog